MNIDLAEISAASFSWKMTDLEAEFMQFSHEVMRELMTTKREKEVEEQKPEGTLEWVWTNPRTVIVYSSAAAVLLFAGIWLS